jgi:hypothetical protein
MDGEFDGDPGPEAALVYTELTRDGGCDLVDSGIVIAVADGGEEAVGAGSATLLARYGPVNCGQKACWIAATPDVDRDGRSEILVRYRGGVSWDWIGLYRVEPCGPNELCATWLLIGPLGIARPGAPEYGLAPGSEMIPVGWETPSAERQGLDCRALEDGRQVLVAWTADPVGQDEFRLVEVPLSAQGGHLETGIAVARVVPDEGVPAPGLPAALCGAPVAGSSGD